MTDEFGATDTLSVTITITGNNDDPVITSAIDSGDVKEDTLLTATGTITAEDIDNVLTTNLVFSGNATGTYGSFSVDATSGAWTYSLDNGTNGVDGTVQTLAEGETRTDSFTVTVTGLPQSYSGPAFGDLNPSQRQHPFDVVGQLPQASSNRAVARTPEQVHHDGSQERKHRGTDAMGVAMGVLTELGIAGPVPLVLNAPALPDQA